jgi:phosphate transport system ATP-binding protein
MQARDLYLGFGSATVLAGINLDTPKGAITALEVLLERSNVYAPGVQLMALRRRVGMVFQRPNPFPMSIAGNILSGVQVHRVASKEHHQVIVETRLKEVGLWDAVSNRLGSSPFNLSGGQQRPSSTRGGWSSSPRPLSSSRTRRSPKRLGT